MKRLLATQLCCVTLGACAPTESDSLHTDEVIGFEFSEEGPVELQCPGNVAPTKVKADDKCHYDSELSFALPPKELTPDSFSGKLSEKNIDCWQTKYVELYCSGALAEYLMSRVKMCPEKATAISDCPESRVVNFPGDGDYLEHRFTIPAPKSLLEDYPTAEVPKELLGHLCGLATALHLSDVAEAAVNKCASRGNPSSLLETDGRTACCGAPARAQQMIWQR